MVIKESQPGLKSDGLYLHWVLPAAAPLLLRYLGISVLINENLLAFLAFY